MTLTRNMLVLTVLGAFAALAVPAPAEAAKCKARMAAKGSGQGILGAGTMNAKVAAITAFEATAAKVHGSRFGKFDNAAGVVFDCKSGTLKATCVVTARPCR